MHTKIFSDNICNLIRQLLYNQIIINLYIYRVTALNSSALFSGFLPG